MRLWVGVENFAKIESAKICINNYTVLVGENNSGKTFLMQLAYGIGNRLASFLDQEIEDIIRSQNPAECGVFTISKDNVDKIVEYYNRKLENEKENIVSEIFAKTIPIEKLYVDISLESDEEYEIYECDKTDLWRERLRKIENKSQHEEVGHEEIDKVITEWINREENVSIVMKTNLLTGRSQFLVMYIADKREISISAALGWILNEDSLFLPASRTGILLLYRDFFANKADEAISFSATDKQIAKIDPRMGGLTQPVYDFLRFLQTYREGEHNKQRFEKEINFFEERLIGGRIRVGEQGTLSYQPKGEKADVPMYLASSMINEIAPLELVLAGVQSKQRLILDEAEASLHPSKQSELVRFLNRLSNRGIQLVISTHSDTIASKINNLYLLSQYVKKHDHDEVKKMLEQFDLERADLIDPDRLFIYEVVNLSNGKSIVREVKGNREHGFQFDQFTKSAMQIYDESTKIGELL